jgi:hypothetical protein
MLLELQKMVAGLLEITESGTPPTQRQLIEFFARLGKAGLLCVVLLDNLGVLFGRLDPDDPVFFVRLRALLQEPSQQGFSLVAASQKSPDELFRDAQWWGSRFDAGMEQIALKGLDESEVDRLIDVSSQHLPIEYEFDSDDRLFIQAIRARTAGHPGKIQEAAYRLLEKKLGR